MLLRLVFTTAVTWSLAVYLAVVIVKGLRTGRMAHSDSTSFVARAERPVSFWALAILFTIMVLGILGVWAKVVINALF